MVVDLKLTADSVEPSAQRALFQLPAADTGYNPYDTTRGSVLKETICTRCLLWTSPGSAGVSSRRCFCEPKPFHADLRR